MLYIVYKITNKINGKFYIGKHQTKNVDDGYMGSGKHLNYAIKKHGLHNFEKEILFIFDNELEMNTKEAELVTEEFCLLETNYNLCPGGKGGWGYINQNNLGGFSLGHSNIAGVLGGKALAGRKLSDIHKNNISLGLIGNCNFKNKFHSEETKIKISKSQQEKQTGNKNSQFGTMWITNGLINKKIKKTDIVPAGWNKGRKIKF